MLGTALVALAHTFEHQIHETSLTFRIEENNALAFRKEELWEVTIHHFQLKFKCDPESVKPTSIESMKGVLYRVGNAALVWCCHPDLPTAHKCLSLTLDEAPYLVSRTVIDSVDWCHDCAAEVLKSEQHDHRIDAHRGRRVTFVQEFAQWRAPSGDKQGKDFC